MNLSRKQANFTVVGFQLVLSIIILSGFVLNIVKLAQLDFKPSYKAEVIRVVGIFPPVGAIVGWITFAEENK